ncbi:MAG: hemerythrin domain-containing protein [Candidatus Nanopelagicales bacterium]
MAVDFAMNGMLHRAMLRELDRIEALIGAGDTAGARKHWRFFSQNLHQHHENEDKYLWPMIRQRSTDAGELATVDAMEAEHGQLHGALDVCDSDFAGAGALPDDATKHVRALRLVLAAHSAHEEADAERILAKYVTAPDLKPFNDANKKSPNAMLVFPWIADGGSASDQAVFDVLPGPVRLFLKPMMNRKYRAWLKSAD